MAPNRLPDTTLGEFLEHIAKGHAAASIASERDSLTACTSWLQGIHNWRDNNSSLGKLSTKFLNEFYEADRLEFTGQGDDDDDDHLFGGQRSGSAKFVQRTARDRAMSILSLLEELVANGEFKPCQRISSHDDIARHLLAYSLDSGKNRVGLEQFFSNPQFQRYAQPELFNTVGVLITERLALYSYRAAVVLQANSLRHSLPAQASHAVNITNSNLSGTNIAQGAGTFSQSAQGSLTLEQLSKEISDWLPRARALAEQIPNGELTDGIDAVETQIAKAKPNPSLLRAALVTVSNGLKSIPAAVTTKVAVDFVSGPLFQWINSLPNPF